MIRNHPLVLGAALCALVLGSAQAQDDQALKNDAKSAGDVLTYGMGYNNQRYSALKQINQTTVKNCYLMTTIGTNYCCSTSNFQTLSWSLKMNLNYCCLK